AEREAAERLLERVPPGVPELALVVPERRRDRCRLGEQELLYVQPDDQPLPEGDDRDDHDQRRQPVDDAPADHATEPASRDRLDRDGSGLGHAVASCAGGGAESRSCPRCSASRTRVTRSKNRGSSRVVAVRGCGRSTGITVEIRPGRGDMTTTRVERKTASAIECVTKTIVEPLACQMFSSSMFIRSRVISSR